MIVDAKLPLRIYFLLIILLMLSACSTFQDERELSSRKSVIPQGMISFNGRVFVASTKPSTALWRSAGWQIASNSSTLVEDQVPEDCTLYPHEGVTDQWIGSCSGNMLIPQEGATHIQVMYTPPDGDTVLIQVAPTPDN